MIVRPGLVYPSGKPATITDYDCEVGSLLTRESWERLKSDGSKALSSFVTFMLQLCKMFVKSENNPLQQLETVV